ncbi:MAG: single-stranded-DNA-specific exonuclease RecJ [Gammaproteobacteria bacterium]|nr:single-stranded-DNA-specific exonuclease RecJ [Gammaproteobacteria bacterium]
MKKQIIRRSLPDVTLSGNIHPLLKRLYLTRGIRSNEELEQGLERLLSFNSLGNIQEAVNCIVDALLSSSHIMVVGDFDADGATSTVLAVSCLKRFGAHKVTYLVPNRFEYGYGLTPEIVEVAANSHPDLLITVDNGISSLEGVARANEKGIRVVITDHHLAPPILPAAAAIVNPNLPGDVFPSKNLAGVGVIFYVMLALRAKLREVNWFQERSLPEPNMASFLDLVALGTIADVVSLDLNNRILVHQGLTRIRAGNVRPGIKALLQVGGKKCEQITASDLGFIAAPRLNAAGRLVDMSLGIECLLAENETIALGYATELDSLNKERQKIEEEMREQAVAHINSLEFQDNLPVGVCLFDESWHQGIIGILASRVKDLLHRPAIAFALSNAQELKGSCRSISGLHIRDALENIHNNYPGLLLKFGGHAMAAGLSIKRENFELFAQIFNTVISQTLSPESLQGIIHSDGELTCDTLTLATAEVLKGAGPWGQGFPEPIFDGQFKVITHRILKEKHLKLVLGSLDDYFNIDAIAFNVDPKKMLLNENDTLHVAYRLDVNEYRGNKSAQLLIEYFDVV